MPPTNRKNQQPPAQGSPASPAAPAASAAPPSRVALSPDKVKVEIPMITVTGPGGQKPYAQRRIELSLPTAESEALREIFDGLIYSGEFKGIPNASPQDAIRWLLRRAKEAHTPAKST